MQRTIDAAKAHRYRGEAANARALAGAATDPDERARLNRIAEMYDRLADEVETRG